MNSILHYPSKPLHANGVVSPTNHFPLIQFKILSSQLGCLSTSQVIGYTEVFVFYVCE